MSQINVDIIAPQSGDIVTVNEVPIKGTVDTISQKSIAIGESASCSQTGSLAIGTSTLENATSVNNTAVGNLALQSASSNCTALGYGAGAVSTAVSGTFVGYQAGTTATTGEQNTIVGSEAGAQLTTGKKNVFIGYRAGVGNSGSSITTGQNNVLIGTNGLAVTNGLSNTIILGDSSTTTLACQVTSITSLSDERDKTEIKSLSVGLDFIKELNPVSFVWDDRNIEGKHGVKDSGFIAQNLKALQEKYNLSDELQLVNETIEENKMYASYGRLIPVLVKAIQDLSKELEILKNK